MFYIISLYAETINTVMHVDRRSVLVCSKKILQQIDSDKLLDFLVRRYRASILIE